MAVIHRIAMSGSAGTGKTTLGRRLAAELGLPFIEEGMRTRLEGGLDLHSLTREGLRDLMEELWEDQLQQQDKAVFGFVSDRSSADFAAFWLHYGYADEAERTELWLERMFTHLQDYTKVVLLPWGVLPLEADGVRSTNRWKQFQFQALVEGLLSRHARPGQVLGLGLGPVEDRARQVLDSLR